MPNYWRLTVVGGLANGILIHLEDSDSNVIAEINDGVGIKTNLDWSRLAKSTLSRDFGNKQLAVSISTDTHPLYLAEDFKLVATVQDDLTGLISMAISIGGFKYT